MSTQEQVLRTGVLFKKGSGMGPFGRKNWKPRYFVLTPTRLQYYTFENGELKGEVTLQGCDESVIEVMPADSMKTGSSASTIWRIAVNAPSRRFLVAAATEMEMNDWVDKLVLAFRINSGQARPSAVSKQPSQSPPHSYSSDEQPRSNAGITDFQNFTHSSRRAGNHRSSDEEGWVSSPHTQMNQQEAERRRQQEEEEEQRRLEEIERQRQEQRAEEERQRQEQEEEERQRQEQWAEEERQRQEEEDERQRAEESERQEQEEMERKRLEAQLLEDEEQRREEQLARQRRLKKEKHDRERQERVAEEERRAQEMLQQQFDESSEDEVPRSSLIDDAKRDAMRKKQATHAQRREAALEEQKTSDGMQHLHIAPEQREVEIVRRAPSEREVAL